MELVESENIFYMIFELNFLAIQNKIRHLKKVVYFGINPLTPVVH